MLVRGLGLSTGLFPLYHKFRVKIKVKGKRSRGRRRGRRKSRWSRRRGRVGGEEE
jgi:hypothetical protein